MPADRTHEFELDDLADASTRDRLKSAFSDLRRRCRGCKCTQCIYLLAPGDILLGMADTTQLNVRVSRVLAERINRATADAGVGRAEWVRARLVEAAEDAERRAAQRAARTTNGEDALEGAAS